MRQGRPTGMSGPEPQRLFGRALDAISEGSLITDANQRILYANAAFTAVTGYSLEEVSGRNCRLLQGPETDSIVLAALRSSLLRGGSFRGEVLNYRKDGTPFWNALTVSPLRDDTGRITNFVSVQRDVTAQRKVHERLQFLALHDSLTGLSNRAGLDRHLSGLARRIVTGTEHSAIGVIDLDDFKTINDTFGHEAGDAILTEFSRRLRGKLRATDFLAHRGGDEFVVVIEGLDLRHAREQLQPILARLHEAVDTAFSPGPGPGPGISVTLKMSLGITLLPPGQEPGNAVFRRADAALHHLKSGNDVRDPWWHLDTTPPTAPDGRTLQPGTAEPDRNAEEKVRSVYDSHIYHRRLFNGGLHLLFQPVIDLRTGDLRFLEALARLRLEDGTILSPGDFLPMLTPQDFDQLFKAGLDLALGQLGVWDLDGRHLRVSVNVSPSTLLHPDCAHWITSTLERHNIAPHRLILEVLEDHIDDDATQSQAFTAILALGVGLAMDDLGAGHSSLRRLTALAFSTVKIDHRILSQLRTSPIPTMTFLATMAQMGQNMGWDVIAEGLEDDGITEAATVLGIPYGQGYHLTRPLPAADVPPWITDFTPPNRSGLMRTLSGALAYHWQFARLGAPHTGPAGACPMTELLNHIGASKAEHWHRQQHTALGDHLASSAELLQWLTIQTTGDGHAGKAEKL